MAIAYSSSGAGAGTETNGAALNLVAPATITANDILIAHVLHTGTGTAPSTPANWTLLFGPSNVGTTATARHWCFGKLAVGTEDGTTISFGTAGGTNGRAGRIYRFTGYVSGTLADVVPAASFTGIPHATDPQGPSVTTTVTGALAVALMCQDDNNTPPAITGMSGGTWAENAEYLNATWGPQGVQLSINTCTPTANPGTVSGGSQVATNDEAGTIGFEIRPNAPQLILTPGVETLTLTTFVPTVLAPFLVTALTASLALASVAPTVTLSAHQTVTPAPAVLTTSTFAPTVSVSNHQTVTPGLATITTSTFAPSVLTPRLVMPSPESLSLSAFVPTVLMATNLTPSVASLALSSFAPSVLTPRLVIPSVASVSLSSFAPTVNVTAHQLVTPGIASLTLSTFAPSVSAGASQTVTPNMASLSISTFAPLVTATDHQYVLPLVSSLTLQTFAPSLSLTANQMLTPGPAIVSLTGLVPHVVATQTFVNLVETVLHMKPMLLRTVACSLTTERALALTPLVSQTAALSLETDKSIHVSRTVGGTLTM